MVMGVHPLASAPAPKPESSMGPASLLAGAPSFGLPPLALQGGNAGPSTSGGKATATPIMGSPFAVGAGASASGSPSVTGGAGRADLLTIALIVGGVALALYLTR